MSAIQWTDETWNPLVGCSKASEGCRNCYAIQAAAAVLRRLEPTAKSETGRATVEAYRAALKLDGMSPNWSGRAVPMPHQLDKPLRWKSPRRVFVNSMSDLFHPTVDDGYIAAVFGVMAATPRHTFQVLTKHPERAARWFKWVDGEARDSMRHRPSGEVGSMVWCRDAVLKREACRYGLQRDALDHLQPWPLPNVWLGTSVEDQSFADKRIPALLDCPAAVHWVSYEPALGPVDFGPWLPERGVSFTNADGQVVDGPPRLGWLVVGGESGAGARPFLADWARSTIRQGRRAGAPVFVKQLGARFEDPQNGVAGRDCAVPAEAGRVRRLRDPKGGEIEEWPHGLQVREWPAREAP